MLLTQALEELMRDSLLRENERRPIKLAVEVFEPGRIGGTPCSMVKYLNPGFDWNAGTLLIVPSEPLTRLSTEDVEAIRQSISKGQSWHAYQEFKEQDAKVKLAEARLYWLANEEACVKHLLTQDGVRYTIHWPFHKEELMDYFQTPAEAIDHAMLLEAQEVKKL